MEQVELKKPRGGRAAKLAALQEEIKAEQDALAVVPVEETEEVVVRDKRSYRPAGKPTNEERADVDMQKREMRLMAGTILLHFKTALTQKKLDFNQELQLFKEISKYLGYANEGNKTVEDIGMDAFAMKYVDLTARIRTVEGKRASK